MTRDEMIARITSRELSAWWALYQVEAEEEERRRDVLESGDGHVIVTGLDDEDGDGDQDDDAGSETE